MCVMKSSTYTPEIADEICNRLSNGEPLRAICRDEHMPAWRTFYDWIAADEEFSARITHARRLGFDAIAEEALEIANTPLLGVREERSGDGYKVVKEDMLGHRKLQIETRLKLLAKWHPQKYGDKQAVELSGHLALGNMSDEDIKAELAALTATHLLPTTPNDGDDLV